MFGSCRPSSLHDGSRDSQRQNDKGRKERSLFYQEQHTANVNRRSRHCRLHRHLIIMHTISRILDAVVNRRGTCRVRAGRPNFWREAKF